MTDEPVAISESSFVLPSLTAGEPSPGLPIALPSRARREAGVDAAAVVRATPAPAPSTNTVLTAIVCGLPDDNTLLVVDWLMLACRASGLVARAMPLGGSGDVPHGMYVEAASPDAAARSLAGIPGGAVDLIVAGEHLELVRAVRAGHADRARTTIVASCRRRLTPAERTVAPEHVLGEREVDTIVAEACARYIAFDGPQVAGWYSLPARVQPSLLLGAAASSGALPIEPSVLRAAIETLDIEARLHVQGLRRGRPLGRRAGGRVRRTMSDAQFVRKRRGRVPRRERAGFEQLIQHVEATITAEDRDVVREAVLLLTEFHGAAYARQLVDWVADVARAEQAAPEGTFGPGVSTTAIVARNLASMMAYPDMPWVAHVKSRRDRVRRLRAAVGASRHHDVTIRDHLPVDAAERAHLAAMGLIGRRRSVHRSAGSLDEPVRVEVVQPTTMRGAMRLRRIRALARHREASPRHEHELAVASSYVLAVRDALEASPELGRIVAQSGALVTGAGAVREATQATAAAYWGRVVRQVLAIDRAAGVGHHDVSRILIPFVSDELRRNGPLALWEHAGRVVGIALHMSRGGSHADAVAFARAMVGELPVAGTPQGGP